MPRSTSDFKALARSRDVKLCGVALAVMLLCCGIDFVALDVSWLRRLELVALDEEMRIRGAQPAGSAVVIVMIDDASVAAVGRWPIPRRKLADAIGLLSAAGATTIGIDLLFAERESVGNDQASADQESGGDAALETAIREAGNVVLPFAFRFGGAPSKEETVPTPYTQLRKRADYEPPALTPSGLLMPLPTLGAHATLGHTVVAYDVDGAPRYDYPALEFDLDYFPSMAVRLVQSYLHVPWNFVSAELGGAIDIGPLRVPTDSATRMLVNYRGPPPAFPTYGFAQLLAGAVDPNVFRDRLVLIGSNALGARDTFVSPFTAVMPGVERLATVVDSMLRGNHLRRPGAMPWYESVAMLVIALALALAVSRLSLAVAALCGVALVAAIAAFAQVSLARYGVWTASAIPMLAVVLTFIALSLYRYGLLDRERRHIRRVFQRYLAPSMVERVVANPRLPELGGELRELTVLFCDLRGFTTLSERLDPATLTRAVNTFLQAATDAILAHGGTVDKYVDDAVMAFWNAPLDQPDHPTLACRAALDIQRNLAARNRDAVGGAPRLDAGVGINTGLCTVGNFGSNHRFDYSAVGDPVNVAARLESATRSYDTPVLLGPATAARIVGFVTRPIGSIALRGRAERLEVYALLDSDPGASSAIRSDVLYDRDASPSS